jgi:hypothetical protein
MKSASAPVGYGKTAADHIAQHVVKNHVMPGATDSQGLEEARALRIPRPAQPTPAPVPRLPRRRPRQSPYGRRPQGTLPPVPLLSGNRAPWRSSAFEKESRQSCLGSQPICITSSPRAPWQQIYSQRWSTCLSPLAIDCNLFEAGHFPRDSGRSFSFSSTSSVSAVSRLSQISLWWGQQFRMENGNHVGYQQIRPTHCPLVVIIPPPRPYLAVMLYTVSAKALKSR